MQGPDSRSSGALAIRAKRNGVQVIENKQFRETPHFAPPTTSMALRLHRETARFIWRKIAFAIVRWSSLRRNGREIGGGFRGSCGEGCDDRKWRRKPLESLRTDSQMAPAGPLSPDAARIDQANAYPRPYRPSISMRFCTAAPEAPLPRLSNLATSKACRRASLANTWISMSFVPLSDSGSIRVACSLSMT
jgi:hypothetical protein